MNVYTKEKELFWNNNRRGKRNVEEKKKIYTKRKRESKIRR